MAINPTRHLKLFSPAEFGNRRVDIIGVGASGSRVALDLAKLGVENIHVWDDDIVEEHNVPNQAYGEVDIGKTKVEALQDLILKATGTKITTHCEKVTTSQKLGEVVFLLTDTMKSRKQIWEHCVKLHPFTRVMFETRMGSDLVIVYTINPCNMDDVKLWESTLCDDKQSEISVCGATITAGPVASITAGIALYQFMGWFGKETGKSKEGLDKEVMLALQPMGLVTRT